MPEKLALAGRYQNPTIRTHLASQYALGTLSVKVQQRVSRLMLRDEMLEQEIHQWQNRLEPINHHIEEVTPPKKVWQKLREELRFNQNIAPSWWQSLFLWQGATAFSLIVVLSLFIWQQAIDSSVETRQGPNYLAVLTADKTLAAGDPSPKLIISAYKSTEAGQSELHFQWHQNIDDNQNFKRDKNQNFTLWAIDKISGEQVSLGALVSSKQKLSIAQWQLIKNSRELWLTKGDKVGDPILFKGECLQLSNWKTG